MMPASLRDADRVRKAHCGIQSHRGEPRVNGIESCTGIIAGEVPGRKEKVHDFPSPLATQRLTRTFSLTSKPRILHRRTVARSRLFQVDAVELMFGNGVRREFEQLVAAGEGGVLVVPVTDDGHVVLVEEFALGTGEYELGFVKGLNDPGETASAAAARELREETGFAPSRLILLDTVTLMPAYSNFRSSIFLATGLHIDPLDGDEPEPLRQHRWPFENLRDLHDDSRITDARTHLALCLLSNHIASTAAIES